MLGDQCVEFLAQFRKNLVVAKGPYRLAPSFQVDFRRPAPEPKVGIVGFPWAVDSAAHHGDGDRVVFGISGHLFDLLGKFDEGFVFDPRAAWARDDVKFRGIQSDDRSEAARVDIFDDLPTGLDFERLLGVRDRQRHADRIADAASDELFKGDAGFDDPIGWQAGFGDPQVEWDIGSELGEALVDFDDLRRIGVFQGDDVADKSDRVEQFAVLGGTGEHGADRIVGIEFIFDGRIDRPAVNTDADGAIVGRSRIDDEFDFVLPRLGFFVVVEVSWVVSDFVDVRSDLGNEPVVFLEVDREVGGGLLADFGQGCGIFIAIDGDPHDIGSGSVQVVDQGDRGGDIGRVGGGHALDGDGVTGTDGDRADLDVSGWVSLDLHGDSWGRRGLVVLYRKGTKPPTTDGHR